MLEFVFKSSAIFLTSAPSTPWKEKINMHERIRRLKKGAAEVAPRFLTALCYLQADLSRNRSHGNGATFTISHSISPVG